MSEVFRDFPNQVSETILMADKSLQFSHGFYSSRINFTKYHCNSQTDGKMLRIAHSIVSNLPHLS